MFEQGIARQRWIWDTIIMSRALAYAKWMALVPFLASTLHGPPAIAAPATTPNAAQKKLSTLPEEADIPSTPSAPPNLVRQAPYDAFRCERQFVFQGKKLLCDSNTRLDAERLRPIIFEVPEAVAELDLYQRNRRKVRNAAYFGTMGLAIAVASTFVAQQFFSDSTGGLTQSGRTIKSVMVYTGAGISVGSLVFALSFNKANEAHIGRAVQNYNAARPDNPIELQFSTGISF
jgi:hypothetical protein